MVEQPKLAEDKWPEIRKIKASKNTGWEYFGYLVKVIFRELGEEKTCQILTSFMTDNANRYVKQGMKGFGIEGNDAWALASYFKLSTGDIIGYKARLIKESPQLVRYQLYPPCLWFPELDIPPSLCRAMGAFEQTACQILNPKIKARPTKLMTAGDPYCEFVFEEI
ncbi:MAG: hypothetical protein FJ006_10255 [Chloroflexi bacterium]|nr:hypothetical protein [Chloroflexota bacterium]